MNTKDINKVKETVKRLNTESHPHITVTFVVRHINGTGAHILVKHEGSLSRHRICPVDDYEARTRSAIDYLERRAVW